MVPKLYHLVFRTILANIHSVPTLAGMPEVKEPTSTDRPTKAVSFCFECRAQPIQRESLFNELIRLVACSCNSTPAPPACIPATAHCLPFAGLLSRYTARLVACACVCSVVSSASASRCCTCSLWACLEVQFSCWRRFSDSLVL